MIAKGAKSVISFKEEVTWGTEPTTGYQDISFSSEKFTEKINTVMSDEIRRDRSVPNVRGGNIAAGGDLTTDFGISRWGNWLRHALAATSASAAVVSTPLEAGVVAIGDVRVSNGKAYACLHGGTLTNTEAAIAATADNLTGIINCPPAHLLTTGRAFFLTGTTAPAGLALNTVYYAIVIDADDIKPASSYANALAGTAIAFTDDGTAISINATPSLVATSGTATLQSTKWVYIGASTLSLNKHVLTAGADMPAGGIAVEKGVLGGDENFYLTLLGGRINTLDIKIQKEKMVESTWGLLFKEAVQTTTPHAAAGDSITDTSVMCYDVALVIGDTLACRPVTEGDISLKNNIAEDVYTLCSRYREELPEARREVSGKISTYFRDATEYTLFKNETTFSLVFSFTSSGKTLIIELPENKFTGSPTPTVSGQGVITSDFEFTSFKNTANYDIRVTIIDGNAALIGI